MLALAAFDDLVGVHLVASLMDKMDRAGQFSIFMMSDRAVSSSVAFMIRVVW